MARSKPTVLVTGAAGYIAAQLLPTFRARYRLRLLDARAATRSGNPVEGLQVVDAVSGPIDVLRPLWRGCDAVVHLGYYHRLGSEHWATSSYEDERTNVDFAQRVLQLALDEGVPRVVMASSNHAADWWEPFLRRGALDVLDPDTTSARSDNFYGWSKVAYENVGFVYAAGRLGGIVENIQIRIGAPREIAASTFFPDGPGSSGDEEGYRRDLGAYISQRDLAQLFTRSIEAVSVKDARGVPFQIFYGISGNTRAFWSIANARRVIGYAPADDSEIRFADDIRAYLVDPARSPRMYGRRR